MVTKLQRWGNSQGVRIPKTLMDQMNLHENDNLEIETEGDRIVLTKAHRHLSLEERMKGYAGDYRPCEWNTGAPSGREIF